MLLLPIPESICDGKLKKIIGFVDYKNDTFMDSFETLEKWKENRSLVNSMIMFPLVPVQENLSGEIPPSYCRYNPL